LSATLSTSARGCRCITLLPYTTLFRSAVRRRKGPALNTDLASWNPGPKFEEDRSRALELIEAGTVPDAEREFVARVAALVQAVRSEEHTSELQSRENLVCRLLLEKKKA